MKRKKVERRYRFREGAQIKLNPQVVGAELESIRLSCGGKLRPVDVVESARTKQSPLHSYFVWNDQEAGKLHREWQARYLINHIEVVMEEMADIGPTRVFVNVRNNEGDRFYVPSKEAYTNEEFGDYVIAELKKRLNNVKGEIEKFRIGRETFKKTLKAIRQEAA